MPSGGTAHNDVLYLWSDKLFPTIMSLVRFDDEKEDACKLSDGVWAGGYGMDSSELEPLLQLAPRLPTPPADAPSKAGRATSALCRMVNRVGEMSMVGQARCGPAGLLFRATQPATDGIYYLVQWSDCLSYGHALLISENNFSLISRIARDREAHRQARARDGKTGAIPNQDVKNLQQFKPDETCLSRLPPAPAHAHAPRGPAPHLHTPRAPDLVAPASAHPPDALSGRAHLRALSCLPEPSLQAAASLRPSPSVAGGTTQCLSSSSSAW